MDIFKIADMRCGKVKDDGYRGIHLYYQKSNMHYPIEIQINTKKDRCLNDWLHIHLYKYENREIKSEEEFKDMLKNVLSSGKEI